MRKCLLLAPVWHTGASNPDRFSRFGQEFLQYFRVRRPTAASTETVYEQRSVVCGYNFDFADALNPGRTAVGVDATGNLSQQGKTSLAHLSGSLS